MFDFDSQEWVCAKISSILARQVIVIVKITVCESYSEMEVTEERWGRGGGKRSGGWKGE